MVNEKQSINVYLFTMLSQTTSDSGKKNALRENQPGLTGKLLLKEKKKT
jgi:hypothetical protein